MTVGWKWRIVERTDLYECCFWQNPSDFFFPWVIFLPFSWIKLIEKRFVLISFFFLLLLKKTQLTETTTCCHHNRISIIITNNSYCFSVLLWFCWAFIHNARTLSVKPLNWLLMEVCFCHWKKMSYFEISTAWKSMSDKVNWMYSRPTRTSRSVYDISNL